MCRLTPPQQAPNLIPSALGDPGTVHRTDPEPGTTYRSEAPTRPDSDVAAGSVPVPVVLHGITVVLPCLDEEANVEQAVRDAVAAARANSEEYEIVVVDDGSTDATALVAAKLAAADPRVRLLIHAHNRGYGHALRSGIEEARMDWVLLADADLQFDLRELADFVPLTATADAIWGRRILRREGVRRRATAAAWNRLVSALFDLEVDDVDCGFKLIRLDLLRSLSLQSGGTLVSTELAVRCRAAGARIAQVGVHHRPRSAGLQKAGTVRALRELARRRRALQRLPRSTE